MKSKIGKYRDYWFKKGWELINITGHLEPVMGCSGFGNGFNEPVETIHHIKLKYRGETIANIADGIEIIDDKYCYLLTDKWKGNKISNFIIYRKVKIK